MLTAQGTSLYPQQAGISNLKTHTKYAGSGRSAFTSAVQTTDGTTYVTLAAIPLLDNTAYGITTEVVARQDGTNATEHVFFVYNFMYYRTNGGPATQQDIDKPVTTIETHTITDIKSIPSGNSV